MNAFYKKLFYFVVFLLSISCGSTAEMGYSPPIPIPIRVGVDLLTGDVNLGVSGQYATPFGTFDLGMGTSYEHELSEIRESISYQDKRLLLIRIDNEVTTFGLKEGEEFRIEFQSENSGYKKVSLIYEDDGDIILELESIDNNRVIIESDEFIPKIIATIRRGQICSNGCIDYGSTVDFCFRSNFINRAKLTVYSYNTRETFPLGDKDLSDFENCFTGPMSAPYGKNLYKIESYDGPSDSVEFCVDDCPGDKICEDCFIE